MEQINQVFAGIKEQFGRLDILVNNAAPTRSSATYWTPTSAPFRKPSTSTSVATSSCQSKPAS
jgi:NAD(P)-dependent dehydrogenase (short-subunit alcohol dehydrogenase family)